MSVTAFYSCCPQLSGKQAIELIDEIASYLAITPSNVQVGLDSGIERHPRYSTARKQGTDGRFEDYRYLVAARYFESGNVRDMRFFLRIVPGSKKDESRRASLSVGYLEEDAAHANPTDIARIVTLRQQPAYGIHYKMPFRNNPYAYNTTVLSASSPQWLQDRQTEFIAGYREGKLEEGYFRDVFPQSILSPNHLSAQIEGMSFVDWVTKHSSRFAKMAGRSAGNLEQIGAGVWLWQLSDAEAQFVRPRMMNAGLLLSAE